MLWVLLEGGYEKRGGMSDWLDGYVRALSLIAVLP